MHAAKGLEFPIVVAADLVARKQFDTSPMLVEAALVDGRPAPLVGVRLPGRSCGGATTPAYATMAERRCERDTEEEKRCLYVACTRARERLIVSGCVCLETPAAQGKGLIDWIREALGEADGEDATLEEIPVHVSRLTPEVPADVRTPPARCVDDSAAPLVVTGPTPPEAEAAIAFPPTVSYSALRLGRECPLSFHATHTLRLGRFSDAAESPALALGSAMHEALQARAGGSFDLDRLGAIARRHRLDPSRVERLERAVSAFGESAVAARLACAASVAAEQPVLVQLGETLLTGSVDLMGWEGDRALVVDYKSGSAPEGSERDEAYELQAQCYALAAFGAGAREVEVNFVFVEHGDSEGRRFEFSAKDEDSIRAEVLGIVEELREDLSRHLPEYRRGLCDRCPAVGGICPITIPVAV